MKKLCALMLSCIMLLSLCACKQTTKPEAEDDHNEQGGTAVPDTPAEDTDQSADKGVKCTDEKREKTVADEQGEPLISIQLTVPMPENLPDAQQYYKDWLNDTEYYCALEQENAAEMKKNMQQMGGTFFPYTYESDYTIHRNDGVLLSVLRQIYSNTGGPHPNSTPMAETFVVETGARLVLDDVFSVPAAKYMPRITELVTAMMDENEKKYGDPIYYDDAREKLADNFNPQDFALTDDSLLIFFPTYTLGSYAAGIQYFYIPFSDIDQILNQTWKVK